MVPEAAPLLFHAPTHCQQDLPQAGIMPLHDWHDLTGWDGVHAVWIVDLLRWLQPRLPKGYRAYIGSTPALTVGAPAEHPDVNVRRWLPEEPAGPRSQQELPADRDASLEEPDVSAKDNH